MISFVLNIPYTILGLIVALFLSPARLSQTTDPRALVFHVRRAALFDAGYMKKWRGMTIGHVVILNSRAEGGDMEHELIHVGQYAKFPIIFPFLYAIELIRNGYGGNKFEMEAYKEAGNRYGGGG